LSVVGRPFDVVFVCTGNRARSPLAAAFLARFVESRAVSVGSRGTLDVGSSPALPEALAAGAARGVDLSEHRASTFGRGEFATSDLVVGFEPFHLSAAVVDGGAALDRSFTIVELVEILERSGGVPGGPSAARLPSELVAAASTLRRGSLLSAPALPDPFGMPQRYFDETADRIERLVEAIARGLALHAHGAPGSV
jgi:protein-tyrosine phosphatase